MKVDAHVMRGPDMCALEECIGKYCDHPRTMGQKMIYWQDDSGEEWGLAMMFGLPLSAASEAHIDRALFYQYDKWLEDEGKD